MTKTLGIALRLGRWVVLIAIVVALAAHVRTTASAVPSYDYDRPISNALGAKPSAASSTSLRTVSTWPQPMARVTTTARLADFLAAKGKVSPTVGELRAAGNKDAHHVIQDAAVRDVPGYRSADAPGVTLPGPSTRAGSPHYAATQAQRSAGVGGTYGAEQIISFVTREERVFYRVFSGDATTGAFLTSVPPKSSAFAREALALPPGNEATFIQRVVFPAGTRLQRSRALPAFGRRGGAEQFELLGRIPNSRFGPGVPLP